jgi:hypothetical protein
MSGACRQDTDRERRAQMRVPADLQVGCRVPASPVSAMLSDLSSLGCRIRMQARVLVQPGSTIVVHLGDDDSAACQVVWIRRDEIGLRFYEVLSDGTIARALGRGEPQPMPERTGDAGGKAGT